MHNIEWHRRWEAKKRFGSFELRESIIARNNGCCSICKMTREEHKIKYKCDITVNHIDGNGRQSKNPNNDPSNLETLCLKCHGSIDGLRADYSKRISFKGENHPYAKLKDLDIFAIKKMREGGLTLKVIAEMFSISIGYTHIVCYGGKR